MSRPYGRGGGGRGGGGDRGGRGGRGGGARGGRSGSSLTVEVFRDPSGTVPQPDSKVAKLEDEWMRQAGGAGAVVNLRLDGAFPPRPGHGTQGAPIIVYANYLELTATPNLVLYRYHVGIQEVDRAPKPSKKKMKRLFQLLLEDPRFRNVKSDFKANLISREKLQDTPLDVVIPFRPETEDSPSENPHQYRYTIQETGTISVAQLQQYLQSSGSLLPATQREEILQALNMVVGHHGSSDDNIATIGQNKHYSVNRTMVENIMALGGGMDALRGVFKSVRPATARLLLNVNVSHAVCYEPCVLAELMRKFGTANKASLTKYLKHLRIHRLHFPQKKNRAGQTVLSIKTIWDLATTNDGYSSEHPPQVREHGAGPKGVKFYLEAPGNSQGGKAASKPSGKAAGGRYVSVYDYFASNYPNIRLDENLPVVNVGNREHPSYLPAEACGILRGQPIGRKLSPDQTRRMIEFACRTPKANADFIVKNGKALLGLSGPKTSLDPYGLSVGRSLITVAARILQPPRIQYLDLQSKPKSVNPNFGSWNMADIRFHTSGKKIEPWTYIWVRSDRRTNQGFNNQNEVKATVKKFVDFMTRTGISMSPPLADTIIERELKITDGDDQANDNRISNAFRTMVSKPKVKPKFVLLILPYNDAALYRKIKTVADTKAGIHTVCVVGTKFAKETRQEQYFANVALKFNLKAGGINQTVEPSKLGIISEGKTMVVGIDVTHPQPGAQDGAPSVAGIVASVDEYLGQWPADIRIQESRKEMVSDLKELVKSRLVLWRKANGQLPENILIYRDGVSEGQYRTVLDEELPLIREACAESYPAIQTKQGLPAITIVVVGKRHHTRFYPVKESEADRSANCKNGTTVDRGVTEVRNWDFYLQAHTCLQGTARSAHYYVVIDEIFRGKKPKNPAHRNAADVLEDLTHNMCHLFGRATKAVSICPPAYYADLLCERARCYLGRIFEPPTPGDTPAASVTGSDAGSQARPEDVLVHADLKDSMFYI